MNEIKYEDFENICRTCLTSCESKPIKQDNLIIEVLNNLTGDRFETNDELPQQICLKCFDKIHEIHAFAFQCKQSHFNLTKCLKNYKNQQREPETNEPIIVEHNTKVDGEKSVNDFCIDELIIKQEITNALLEDVIPEINEQNTCFQDDLLAGNSSGVGIEIEAETVIEETGLNDIRVVNNEQYKCYICNKLCTNETSFKSHLRTHSGELPHRCEICNKGFNSRNTLSNHKRIHSDERPHECDVCGKSFKFAFVLMRHKRTHSGEPNNECNICFKMFRRFSDLTRHNRVHSGERPYTCLTCNKTFGYSGQLARHKKIHRNEFL